MAVNERMSEQRIHTRYETQKAVKDSGRFSTKENHGIAYAGMARTVAAAKDRKLVGAISVYDMDHKQLH